MADAVATVAYLEDGGANSDLKCQGITPKVISMGKMDIVGDYTTNGVPIPASIANLFSGPSGEGLSDIFFVPKDGYLYEYIPSTGKVKIRSAAESHTHAVALDSGASAAGSAHTHAFSSKPALVIEETVTVTTHAGTLANVPLYIVTVQVTAGDVTGAFNVIPTGKTPLTKQVAVNFTTGGLTFVETDAVTSVKVSYIPKRASGYLSAVTVDEVVVASASKVNLAARAGLVQYVWDETDGVLCGLEPPGEQPSATHTAVVDINDSGNSSIDSHADDATNNLKVTYVPYSQLPPGCFIDDTDITLSSEAYNFVTNHYGKTIIPGLGTQLVGEVSGGNNSAATWQGPSGTAGEGIATWNPAINYILTNQDTAMVTTAIPWMILDIDQLTPFGTNANESTHTHASGTLADAASGAGATAGAAGEVANGTALDIEGIAFFAYGI